MGRPKAYQVRQLLAAIDRLEVMRAEKGEDWGGPRKLDRSLREGLPLERPTGRG